MYIKYILQNILHLFLGLGSISLISVELDILIFTKLMMFNIFYF